MTSDPMITLYDSASLSGKPWNTIVLKARYALSYKGVPYKTIWLEYPEIEPTLRSIGALPTSIKPDGSPFYTLPVIVDPSHRMPSGGPTVVSDSWKIAEYLDDTYPDSGLLLPGDTKALQMLFQTQMNQTLFYPVARILVPLMYDLLNETSRPYWRRTRETFFNAKLEEICPKGTQKWEEAWEQLQKGFTSLATLLDKNGSEGKDLVMGRNVTFADFIILSILESIHIIVPDEWEGRVKYWDDGRWNRFAEQCTSWKTLAYTN